MSFAPDFVSVMANKSIFNLTILVNEHDMRC